MSEPYSNIPERVAAIEAIIPNLATKTDLAQLEIRLNGKLDTLTRWMIGTLFTVAIGFIGLYTALKP